MGAGHRPKPAWLRSAERQGLVSAMNATKWREATEAMRVLSGGPPRFRIKDIDAAGPGGWDREWFHHVGPDYCSIEWLEIDPRDCDRESIRMILSEIGAPYEEAGQFFRVIGYKK